MQVIGVTDARNAVYGSHNPCDAGYFEAHHAGYWCDAYHADYFDVHHAGYWGDRY